MTWAADYGLSEASAILGGFGFRGLGQVKGLGSCFGCLCGPVRILCLVFHASFSKLKVLQLLLSPLCDARSWALDKAW